MKTLAILLAILTVTAHAADHGFFLDPNVSSIGSVLPTETKPLPSPITRKDPPAPTPIVAPALARVTDAQLSRIPTALHATINTVVRIRHEWPKTADGVVRIDHGTGALVDGLLLTARHVIEGEGTNICEINGAWIPCRLLIEDKDIDIAILEPMETVQPKPYTVVNGCHSSVKGTPIAVLPMKRLSTLWMNIPGFHHGASGSPLIENGKVIAVAIAIRSEIESDFVQIVPYALWANMWETARSRSSVASK